jgi:hypothetical protein
MAYNKIKSYLMSEAELRQLWSDTYCNSPVTTFDGIKVKFYSNMFEHAFFESYNRIEKDKSILSLNRCEKMLWIKDTLEDSKAVLKQGWIKKTKTYDNNRRVALVKENYVVIILIYAIKQARLISAYEINDDDNLKLFLEGPDWI